MTSEEREGEARRNEGSEKKNEEWKRKIKHGNEEEGWGRARSFLCTCKGGGLKGALSAFVVSLCPGRRLPFIPPRHLTLMLACPSLHSPSNLLKTRTRAMTKACRTLLAATNPYPLLLSFLVHHHPPPHLHPCITGTCRKCGCSTLSMTQTCCFKIHLL